MRPLHDLIVDAAARCARLQDESRAVLAAIHTSTAQLERTVEAIQRRRAVRKQTERCPEPS
jgi:hypothetical protein